MNTRLSESLAGKFRAHLLPTLLVAGSLLAAAAAAAEAQTPAATETTGSLQPGDVIRLRIWREPDLSGEFPVDEKGTAVFPRLGPISVVGLPLDSLKQRLVDSYTVYLRNPAIEVTLLRRITILGAVRNPGLYPVDPTMTLTDAFALAGGISPEAKANKVELVRGGQRTQLDISQATRIQDTAVRSGDQLFVPTRSWLSRNTWVITAGVGTTVSILLAVLR